MLFRKPLFASFIVVVFFSTNLQAQFTELNNPIPEEKKWNFWVDARFFVWHLLQFPILTSFIHF